MHGTLVLKPMLKGEQMTLPELHYQPGTKAPLHTHSHDPLSTSSQVESGLGLEMTSMISGQETSLDIRQGLFHTVETLVESTIIEIKSPAPDIATFIRAREQK